jgi:hypothetical protein
MPNFRSFGAVSVALWLFEVEKEGKIDVFCTTLELENSNNDDRY